VKRDLKEIKKSGKITRPFFGVRYLTINKEFSKKIDSEVDFGALVVKGHSFNVAVIKDSPADKSGIKEGDIILTWNKNKITTENSIQDYLSKSEIGEKVDLEILRDGENINTVIELTERK
jgi:S1-C subfamily serine protease